MAIGKPDKNLGQMKGILSKIAKWPPKPLEKHYLEKVFVTRFREVEKPYKTNGKTTFPDVKKRFHKTL